LTPVFEKLLNREPPGFRLNIDRTAVLFHNDVVAHRKAMLRASPYLFRGFASTPVDEAVAKLE
jgi:hypothetical protein